MLAVEDIVVSAIAINASEDCDEKFDVLFPMTSSPDTSLVVNVFSLAAILFLIMDTAMHDNTIIQMNAYSYTCKIQNLSFH